ncbi:MAG TPA: sigma-70 family RNA polymerase sigma factor [Lacipirellulaceae bacterium]|nr:sigma-70 family RNA polymerase sigma factor [Lacipirellulaceae bacterium]
MIPPEVEIDRLIALAQVGDRDALGQLCARYRPFLQMIATMKVGRALERRMDASDIVQETEIEMVRGIQDFRGKTEPEMSAWLKQMLRRNIADKVRDNRAAIRDLRREQYLDGASASASITWMQPTGREESPSQFVMNGEAALSFALALQSLPPEQGAVVRMRYLEGLKLGEIAAGLNKSPGAVVGLLRRGQDALRAQIGSISRFG